MAPYAQHYRNLRQDVFRLLFCAASVSFFLTAYWIKMICDINSGGVINTHPSLEKLQFSLWIPHITIFFTNEFHLTSYLKYWSDHP
jgi:hypothetical protein